MADMPAGDDHEIERLKQRMLKFEKSYQSWEGPADHFRKDLESALSGLMKRYELSPAVLESRIKPWDSAAKKAERKVKVEGKDVFVEDVLDLYDFVGFRLVFLLKNEVANAVELIRETLDIGPPEYKGAQLNFNEFGYRAIHLIGRVPPAGLPVPNYTGGNRFQFEIQLRTLSEHNYAVASRVLQYRQAEGVPPSVRRSLHRLAAILEVVDSEIERVTKEKLAYAERVKQQFDAEEQLNVDLIVQILDKELSPEHRDLDDPYEMLFDNLTRSGINTAGELRNLIRTFKDTAMAVNRNAAQSLVMGEPAYRGDLDKAKRGIFHSHVGLVLTMLKHKGRA